MKNNGSGLRARLKSFGFAFKGLAYLFKNERNARIHLVAGFTAALMGVVLEISTQEWGLLASAIALVLISETFNSAIELFADAMHPEYNEKIGRVKDLCAGAVLMSAFYAVCIGLVVFGPRLLELSRLLLIQ